METEGVNTRITVDNSGAITGFKDAGGAASGFQGTVKVSSEKVEGYYGDVATAGENSANTQITAIGGPSSGVIGAHTKVIASVGKVALSAATFAGGVAGLAYTFDAMEDSALRVEKANQKVEKATGRAGDAEGAFQDAVIKFGENSPEAIEKLHDLEIANEDVRLAIANAQEANEDNDKAQLYTAITIVPQIITAATGVFGLYKDIKGAVDLYKKARLLATEAEGLATVPTLATAGATAAAGTAAGTATAPMYGFAGALAAAAAPAVILAGAVAAIAVSAKTTFDQSTTRDPSGKVTTNLLGGGPAPGGFSNAQVSKMSVPAKGMLGWGNALGFLATGGYVEATPGGQMMVLAEGGEGEYVIPESKMPSVFMGGAGSMPTRVNGPSGSSGSTTVNVGPIYIQGGDGKSMVDQLTRELKRQNIRVNVG